MPCSASFSIICDTQRTPSSFGTPLSSFGMAKGVAPTPSRTAILVMPERDGCEGGGDGSAPAEYRGRSRMRGVAGKSTPVCRRDRHHGVRVIIPLHRGDNQHSSVRTGYRCGGAPTAQPRHRDGPHHHVSPTAEGGAADRICRRRNRPQSVIVVYRRSLYMDIDTLPTKFSVPPPMN